MTLTFHQMVGRDRFRRTLSEIIVVPGTAKGKF
jgi:hypothetical protein